MRVPVFYWTSGCVFRAFPSLRYRSIPLPDAAAAPISGCIFLREIQPGTPEGKPFKYKLALFLPLFPFLFFLIGGLPHHETRQRLARSNLGHSAGDCISCRMRKGTLPPKRRGASCLRYNFTSFLSVSHSKRFFLISQSNNAISISSLKTGYNSPG